MNAPRPEMSAMERLALNQAIARSNATGFRKMPHNNDFEILCSAAETAGWVVGLTVSEPVEHNLEGGVARRELETLNLRRKATAKPRFVFAVIAGDLGAASRKALAMLKGQAA